MTNQARKSQISPKLVRRYTIAFALATLFGMLMVFFAVAGRRYQLMEEAKKNGGRNPLFGIPGTPTAPAVPETPAP